MLGHAVGGVAREGASTCEVLLHTGISHMSMTAGHALVHDSMSYMHMRSSDAVSPTTTPTGQASMIHEQPAQPLACLLHLNMRVVLRTATCLMSKTDGQALLCDLP